jgi:hypothetical protein
VQFTKDRLYPAAQASQVYREEELEAGKQQIHSSMQDFGDMDAGLDFEDSDQTIRRMIYNQDRNNSMTFNGREAKVEPQRQEYAKPRIDSV